MKGSDNGSGVNASNSFCVLYSSKTGFAKNYAEYIAAKLGCSALDADAADIPQAETYIVGGGVYAGVMRARRRVMKLVGGGRRVVAFAVGLLPADEGRGESIAQANFPGVRCFYFRGGYRPEKLSAVQRFLMNLLRRAYEKKNSPEFADTVKAVADGGADYSNLSDADALVNFVLAERA